MWGLEMNAEDRRTAVARIIDHASGMIKHDQVGCFVFSSHEQMLIDRTHIP
jgi:hypothetical protein